MDRFIEISDFVEDTLIKFDLDIKINLKFSNFSENFDAQINELVRLKNDTNYEYIVKELTKKFEKSRLIEDFEILESGFINIKFSNLFLEDTLTYQLDSFIKPIKQNGKTALFDYGGANIGKSLHVGHIRTLNIGRSLESIYTLAGYKTITDIHFGDWGMPIALIIAYIEREKIDIKSITHNDLENIYPEASRLSQKDEEFYKKALTISKEMNTQDKKRLSQWKIIHKISTDNIKNLLSDLGYKFDYYLGESDVIDLLPDYIEKLKEQNLVRIDNGALVANDNQEPPALITKSDGSYMYLTTDIGTVLYREFNLNCDSYIYVVDERQKKHFEQLFNLVDYFKISNSDFSHVGFGTVNDINGKPLKTRDGENYKLVNLFNDIIKILEKTNPEKDTATNLAKSVLTFSDLVTKRTSNYIFDLEKFTNINGKSAIFIQYAQVRAKRLLEQGNFERKFSILDSFERGLVLEIIKYRHYFEMSINSNEPHHLAEYAYSLCHEFNKFYTNNKIFTEDVNEQLRSHRLFIVNMFHNTILQVFKCLGMVPVDKM